MTEPDEDLEAEVDAAVAPAVEDWWHEVLAVERAYEPDPPEIIRRMELNGLKDPENS
ncbi:hypothetical protein [Actinomycetospora callitridis]|uniref:hypothetical protein n=1 Tax=Actinomycetospora callitridis TaxID=913944 RepID=UPI002366773E|nr:hypothetical protein [Actinomycetospora callitridis]MDD7920980.1 hypothetical protein [Actinomycetospora callitridis]